MKKSNRIKDIIGWIAVNSIIATLAYFSAAGHTGPYYLLQFIVWPCAILIIIASTSPSYVKDASTRGRTIPAWLSTPIHLSLAAYCAWHGLISAAIGILFLIFFLAVIFHRPRA